MVNITIFYYDATFIHRHFAYLHCGDGGQIEVKEGSGYNLNKGARLTLTASDINQIKISVADVVEPRFDETTRRLDETHTRLEDTRVQIDSKFSQIKTDIDTLSAATNRKFHAVFTDVSIMREDLYVVKQMVTEHGFRIARLESHPENE